MNALRTLIAFGALACGVVSAATPALTLALAPAPAAAPDVVTTHGTVTVGGKRIEYRAVAGTLIVHPKGWDDTATTHAGQPAASKEHETDDQPATASMFYAAYFKKGAPVLERPLTFIFNGGPGSASMWLHMGSFGPRRVIIKEGGHTPGPYNVVDNGYSLLDVSDLVFIDAPGVGFSRIWGKDKEKAFYGLDADAHAFAEFITGFLSQFQRWNSPRYIFGESYGATRTAILVNMLASEYSMDVNGVILLSQVLNFGLGAKGPQYNPGIDEGYIIALPAYAASAWLWNKLPGTRPPELEPFLHKVEQYALNEYALALHAGSTLEPARREAVAKQMSEYTGLSTAYILKSNLRIDSGQFRKALLDDQGLTLGMCDSRFTAPSIDPMSKEADYAVLPDLSLTLSAYVSTVNDYVRGTLHYGEGRVYKPMGDVDSSWSYERAQPPNSPTRVIGVANVLLDLAAAMKSNPNLKVMVHAGYYDFCTTYFQSWYEMHHLPIPESLQANIEYHYYPTGHWPYNNDPSLKKMHDNVAEFIRRSDNVKH